MALPLKTDLNKHQTPCKVRFNPWKVRFNPHKVGFNLCKVRSMAAILWFMVMAVIHDGCQDVQIEEWPKLSGVWLMMQIPIFNGKDIVVISVIFGNDWYPRWLTTW